MQNLLLITILVSFFVSLLLAAPSAHAYMKNMVHEELVVPNAKIRMKPSRKLVVRPKVGGGVELLVAVQGEVNAEIKEVFFNGIKGVMKERKFYLEYPVPSEVHESRIYAHDDPKHPNYAVVRFKIEKLGEIIKFAEDFFQDLYQRHPVQKWKDAGVQSIQLEYRHVRKSPFYEPFLVLFVGSGEVKKWRGNQTEKLVDKELGRIALGWALDESVLKMVLGKGMVFEGIEAKRLYPAGMLPWEMTDVEHELGPPLPDGLYKKAKPAEKVK